MSKPKPLTKAMRRVLERMERGEELKSLESQRHSGPVMIYWFRFEFAERINQGTIKGLLNRGLVKTFLGRGVVINLRITPAGRRALKEGD